jgi:Chaperone of endosialidase
LSLGSPNDGRPVFKVGIGTKIPEVQLEVNGTTRTTVLQITSARAAKEGFAPVDTAAMLAKVAALPIATWAYTNSPGVRHVGPVAEDFHAAFALGDSDKHIACSAWGRGRV